MNRDHRIIPRRPEPPYASRLHRPQFLGTLLFLGLFAIFSIIILTSRLGPIGIRAHADTATAVRITNASGFDCDDTIPVGTSLKSFPCLPLQENLTNFFDNLSSNGDNIGAMYIYNPSLSQKWEVYNASLPNYVVQRMEYVGERDGIYFVMSAAEHIDYEGFLASVNNILLRQGWNLAGYTTNRTRPLATAIQTINTTYERIKTLNGTEETGTYLIDDTPPGGDSLTQMEAYHGYWIYMNTSDVWTVIK